MIPDKCINVKTEQEFVQSLKLGDVLTKIMNLGVLNSTAYKNEKATLQRAVIGGIIEF